MADKAEVTFTHVLQHRVWGLSRTFKTYRNKLNSILWPGSIFNLAIITGAVTAVRLCDVTVLEPIKIRLEVLEMFIPLSGGMAVATTVFSVSSFIFVISVIARRLMLRSLLAYRAWMYEPPGKQSFATILWGLSLKMLRGWTPTLYSYQSSLPRMPVPPLRRTMEQLIASLEPVYSHRPKEFEEIKLEAKEFEENLGPKLQRALVLKSWWAHNFVSDWWEKYVYLMGRSPLPINSNYYIMDQGYWTPSKRQCARAAGVLYQMLLVREDIVTENLEPLMIRDTIPICMDQYKRMFSTARVPGEEIDELVNYLPSESQHVVVNRRGLLYKVDIVDAYGRLLNPSVIEKQFEWIVQDADSRYCDVPENERLVPVLTSMDRTAWAKARNDYFSTGVNKESIHWVESSVIMVVLGTTSYQDLSSRASYLLHGDVGQFWFDKSIELICMSDGHIGLNCEHSFGDAPVVAHVSEFNFTYDVISELYDKDGHCNDIHKIDIPIKLKSKPTPLSWEVDQNLASLISRACNQAQKNISDLDLVLCDHDVYGKGVIKKCKLSPDAFIQMALHTTYRKLTGVPVLTYEASMTRLYKHGRTETVRSLTKEANDFVVAFLDPDETPEEKRRLLKRACENHALMYKDAMNGKGLDRHLFALYVASRGLGIDCEFLKKILSIPWTLSTSQQPQQQISWSPGCGEAKYSDKLSPGGGFGPVANDGYGVSYMVPGDLRIFFHVSSRRSAPGTSSQLYMETLRTTMKELRALFAEASD